MEGVPASHNPVLQEVLDLRPYINTSAAAIQESFSVERTYVVFRTLGLRHLVVVDRHNHVKGIVTRKVWQGVPALCVNLVVYFQASSCLTCRIVCHLVPMFFKYSLHCLLKHMHSLLLLLSHCWDQGSGLHVRRLCTGCQPSLWSRHFTRLCQSVHPWNVNLRSDLSRGLTGPMHVLFS